MIRRAPLPPEERGRLARWFFIAAGSISLALGTIGLFVPLLPTTPFLLLAAASYLRGSRRLNAWLLSHRVFGKLIQNYRDHHGIPLRVKVGSITLLWITIGFSAAFAVEHVALRLLLLAIAVGVTIHLARLRTVELGAAETKPHDPEDLPHGGGRD